MSWKVFVGAMKVSITRSTWLSGLAASVLATASDIENLHDCGPKCVRWDITTSGAAGKLPCFCVDLDLLALLDKEGNAHLNAGLQPGGFGHATACRVAANTRLGVGHRKLHLGRKLQPDRIAVVLVNADDGSFEQQVECIAYHLLAQIEGLKGLLIEEVRAIGITVEIGSLDSL